MNIDINGINTYFLDIGEGSVCLFLQGWGAGVEVYAPLLESISKYCRVVAPDMPGFGRTPEPPTAWDADDYTKFVTEFMSELGLYEFFIFSHSNGCRVATKLLAEGSFVVKKTVMMGPAVLRPKRGAGYYFKVYTYKLGKKILSSRAGKSLFPEKSEKLSKNAGSEDYRNASPMMKNVMIKLINADLSSSLTKISSPVLLIWGDADTATPYSLSDRMVSMIPDAGLVTVKGGGHYPYLQDFSTVTSATEYFFSSK